MEPEGHPTPTCKNCGTPLPGAYCPQCGQRDYDINRSFGEIAAELAESFWNFDTKLFRGVFELLFHPGFLTTEYLAGRRVRQVPPLRFYLFVSILFFLTNSFDPGKDLFVVDSPQEEVSFENLGLDPGLATRIKEAAKAAKKTPDPTKLRLKEFFRDKYKHRAEISRMIAEHLPKLVFACLPIFALITRVVFRRAKLGYLSHLVMAMHLHSFYFLFSLTAAGWVLLLGMVSDFLAGLGTFAAVVYPFVYCFMAAQRVFGGSRGGTFWRSALAALLYAMTLGTGFMVFVAVVLLLA